MTSRRTRHNGTAAGQPSYNEEFKINFLRYLERNLGNVSKTCRDLGIKGGRQTVWNWKKRDEWFKLAVEEIQHRIFDDIEGNVFHMAVHGALSDPQAMGARKFLLTYHPAGRKRGYRKTEEVVGEDGGPIQVKSFVDLVGLAREGGTQNSDHAASGRTGPS